MNLHVHGNANPAPDPAPYLFIAGAPRCGTTTLFDNLASHPAIAPSRIKEPGFLLPRAFPMKQFRLMAFEEGLDAFRDLFGGRPGVRMEASATYLYAPGVAERIGTLFPNAKVVMILRDPVARLVSEYRFAMMLRVVPHGTPFPQYLAWQRECDSADPWREPEQRALSNGLYSRFIESYLAVLGRSRVHVTWTEALNAAPVHALQDICRFAGIDAGYFATHRFASSNRSRQVRHPAVYALWLRSEAWRARRAARGKGGAVTRLLRACSRPLLDFSTEDAQPMPLAEADRRFLAGYYAGEPARLERLLGQRPHWPGLDAS